MCQDISQKRIPPDGGYGWVIVFACALKKFIIIPIIFNFGVVLQESYDETNVSPTEGNRVIVLRHTIEMLLSLFGGPLLQHYTYRKLAVFGSLLVFAALVLTSTASNFWQLLIYYGILLSIGEAASVPAFDLALNSFFKDKRTKAIGIVTFFAGLGPILIPLLMSSLLYSYGWRYTVLTLSALSLHCLLASCLLRPIKWYTKVQPTFGETVLIAKTNVYMPTSDTGKPTPTQNTANEERHNSLRCLTTKLIKGDIDSHLINATSCPNIVISRDQEAALLKPLNTQIQEDKNNVKETDSEFQCNKNKTMKRIVDRIVKFFDLTLLKDPVFVNILCGLCLGPSVEVSFTLLLPTILKDMRQLEASDITKLTSIIAFSDVLFRLVGPFITEPWHKSPRVIYMFTLLASVASRSAVLFATTYNELIYVALAIGISKGVRSTYLKVILPDYVPLNRLPHALGIVKFFRGITIASIGSISLTLRDATESYYIPIIILNIFTMATITMWSTEILYLKFKRRIHKDKTPNPS